MFEATGAVGANAAAAASQAVRTPTARRIAHTPSPVPQKLELVETKGNKKTKKKKEKQFEKCREFGMKIHISYFLLPGTEFSFPSVVLPNLSTKKLGRDTERRKVQRQRGSGRAGRTESLEAGQGEAAEHGGWSQETGCWHCPSSSSVAARAAFFHVFYLLSFACFVRTAACFQPGTASGAAAPCGNTRSGC